VARLSDDLLQVQNEAEVLRLRVLANAPDGGAAAELAALQEALAEHALSMEALVDEYEAAGERWDLGREENEVEIQALNQGHAEALQNEHKRLLQILAVIARKMYALTGVQPGGMPVDLQPAQLVLAAFAALERHMGATVGQPGGIDGLLAQINSHLVTIRNSGYNIQQLTNENRNLVGQLANASDELQQVRDFFAGMGVHDEPAEYHDP